MFPMALHTQSLRQKTMMYDFELAKIGAITVLRVYFIGLLRLMRT